MLTGGFAQLRNIESVSTALVFVSQRLRGIGEDGEAISGLVPKLQEDFKRIADIDISDGNDGLRSTYDILSDMARVFPTLTEQQRQYLAEQAAGNRNVKTLNAILSGWQDVEKAVSSALNSQNSALIENAKYMDSIDGKTQRLQSSFQEMANTLIDSGIVKAFLDIANGLVQIVSVGNGVPAKIIAVTTAIVGLTAAAKAFKASNFGGGFLEGFKNIGRPRIPGFRLGMLPHVS